ncbi:MAG: hypothetical protein KatS3mg029_0768 [Saprospiraceae bacterium]|nr:MAG: hypothetical protein KatS3mg029_0768 [Saprospiraceae bacterium]
MLKKNFSKSKPVAKVQFTLPAEAAQGAKDVRVLGDFNDWSWENGYKMELRKNEYIVEVELPVGKEYQFRYLIDNHIWENDWQADAYVPTAFGAYNSVLSLVVPANGSAKRKTSRKTTAKNSAEAEKETPVAKASKPAPAKTTKAAKDDLTKIEGVGPKIASLLKEAGITTYEELAKAKVETLKGILEKAGSRYKMHDPTTWPKQAALAAKGEWDKLEKLQAELKGGRK